MFYLIKSENIFKKFCRDIYIIEYQKYDFLHIYFLIFLYSANQFFKISQIDEIIYAKLFKEEIDSLREYTRIITLVLLYSFYKHINLHLLCISNT